MTTIQSNSNTLVLEDFLPFRLSTLSYSVTNSIATLYNNHFNLSIPEWRIIVVLGHTPNMSAISVSRRTSMDKVAVSRALNKLINNGYVNREYESEDRRRSILKLTEQGEHIHQKLSNAALQIEQILTEELDEEEVSVINKIFEKLTKRTELFTEINLEAQ
ncbi:MAG: MarR family transcriptional regulator [Woeseiaceae bacterium]|jgi:DNA-binding MarR family transcriptional regulator|nr:MarR family transcriptional regulator [Woeseiaceae bacterium]